MASLLPYRKVQRADGGFDFLDPNDRKTTIEKFTQATGVNGSALRQELARAGDRQSQQIVRNSPISGLNTDDNRTVQSFRAKGLDESRINKFISAAQTANKLSEQAKYENSVGGKILNTASQAGRLIAGGAVAGVDTISRVGEAGALGLNELKLNTVDKLPGMEKQRQADIAYGNNVMKSGENVRNFINDAANNISGDIKTGMKTETDREAKSISSGKATAGDLFSAATKSLDTASILPTAKLVGAGSKAIGTTAKNTVKAVQESIEKPVVQAAEQKSGLKALNVLNDNEAYTLSDYADIVTKRYNAPNDVRNKVVMQARNAAKTAGFDITNMTAADADRTISRYLHARDNYKSTYDYTKRNMAQGGFAKIPGKEPKTPQSRQAESLILSQEQLVPQVQQKSITSSQLQQPQPISQTNRVGGLGNESRVPTNLSQPSVDQYATGQTIQVPKPQSYVESIQQKPGIVKEQRRAITDGANATYGLRESFDAADNVPDELKQSLGAFGNSRTVKTNKELWQNAQQRTGLDSAEAMKYFNENNNDEAVATGYALINKYMKAGNTKEAGDIAMTMAERALESGRQTQAYAMMKKLTPEGSIAYVARKVNRYLDQHPEQAGKVKWNEEVQASLYKLAEEVNALPEGRARNLKVGELQMKIDNIFPSSLADKAITVWKAGLLTSLRTQERNLVGNFINGVSELAATAPGSLADRLMSLRTKKRTLVTNTGEGLGTGAKYGGQIGLDQLRTGIDVTDSNLKMNVNHITWGDNAVEKVLKGYTESVFRTLGASDKVFKESARSSSLWNQALAMGATKKYKGAKFDDYVKKLVNSPTAKMLETADYDASRATFTHDNVLGDLVKKGKQSLRNQKSQIPSAVADIIVPFTQVPTGVASQLFAYSPANIFKSMYDIGKVLVTGDSTLQRGAAQGFGRSVVGTSLIGAGAYLMSKGLMTGQPEDDAEKAQWEAEGKMPNSIKIGNRWYQLGSIGPQTILLLAGGQAVKDYKEGRNPLITTAGNLAKNFKDQTFLKGMSSALDAVDDPKRYATNFVESTATSVIPNIVKDVAKAIDPNVREAQGLVDRFKASLPGVSKSLPERLDSYGQPLKNRGIGAMIDLFNSSKEKELPEAVYIDALRESIGTSEHVPTKADKTITINGESKKLTSQELHDYQEYIGIKGKEMIARASKDDSFKKLSDEEKASEINKQLQAINTAAKIKLFGNQTKSPSADVKNILKNQETSLAVSSLSESNLTPSQKYNNTLEDYNKNKDTMSEIKRYAVEGSLKKMKVAAPFSNDTLDLYAMSKEKIYDFVSNNKDGKKLVDQITSYDKALYDAGLISSLKFKAGIAPSTAKGKSGRKGSIVKAKSPIGLKEANNTLRSLKVPTFAKASSKVPTTPTQKKTALKTYNASKSKAISAKRGVSRTA